MSIAVPRWMAGSIQVCGCNWLKCVGGYERSHHRSRVIVDGGLRRVHAAPSYTASAQVRGRQSSSRMPSLIEARHTLRGVILQRGESGVVGALVDQARSQRIGHAVERLAVRGIVTAAVAGPPPDWNPEMEAVDGHGNAIVHQADADVGPGLTPGDRVGSLPFTIGGSPRP